MKETNFKFEVELNHKEECEKKGEQKNCDPKTPNYIGFILRVIISLLVLLLFYKLGVYSEDSIVEGLLVSVVAIIPILTEFVENEKYRKLKERYLFFMTPMLIIIFFSSIGGYFIGDKIVMSQIPKIKFPEILTIFGFGLVAISISFGYISSNSKKKILATMENKIYFIDLITLWTIHLLISFFYLSNNNYFGILLTVITMILEFFVVMHYYLREILIDGKKEYGGSNEI